MSKAPENFYLLERGKTKGPYKIDYLQGLKARGRLSRAHKVKQGENGEWLSPEEIPELNRSKPPGRATEPIPGPVENEPVEAVQVASVDWYYVHNNQQRGPVPQEHLQDLLATGELPGDALVWTAGRADWYPATEVPEFSLIAGANQTVQNSSGNLRWLVWSAAGLSLLLLIGALVVFVVPSFGSGDPLLIDTIEAENSQETLRKAVGFVVSGWKFRGEDGVLKETFLAVGPNFDGPYKKVTNNGKDEFVAQKPDKRTLYSDAKSLYLKESKDNFYEYRPLTEDFCFAQKGAGQLIYFLGSTGTCFLITPDGYALTNKHVIADAYKYQNRKTLLDEMKQKSEYRDLLEVKVWVFFEGKQHEADIVHVSEEQDLAILKIDGIADSPFFPLSATVNENLIPRGSKVYALGYPKGASININEAEEREREGRKTGDRIKAQFDDIEFDYSQFDGSISRLGDRAGGVGKVVQHNADISEGCSGGPLLTKEAVVYGINTWTNKRAQGIHFAQAIDQFRPEIEQHVTSERGPVWLE